MAVTLSGNMTEVNELAANALFPIEITLLGIETEVIDVQEENAKFPIATTVNPSRFEGIWIAPPMPV